MDDMDKFDVMDKKRLTMGETHYTPPSNLKIPPEVKDEFEAHGYRVKWIRADAKSIRKRLHPSEGFTFVSPDEIDPQNLIMLGDVQDTLGNAAIRNGDLVLMKVRIEKAEARKKYYQSRTKAQSDAIEQRLTENAISHNGTRSVVRTGKKAHFSTT